MGKMQGVGVGAMIGGPKVGMGALFGEREVRVSHFLFFA